MNRKARLGSKSVKKNNQKRYQGLTGRKESQNIFYLSGSYQMLVYNPDSLKPQLTRNFWGVKKTVKGKKEGKEHNGRKFGSWEKQKKIKKNVKRKKGTFFCIRAEQNPRLF